MGQGDRENEDIVRALAKVRVAWKSFLETHYLIANFKTVLRNKF